MHPPSSQPTPAAGTTRTIWRLAWPQILMMFFHFWIGFVDVYVAGLLSRDVQASLGIITQVLFFFLVVAMALANGAVAAVSQSLGAGRTLRGRRFVALSLAMVLVAGLVITAVMVPLRALFLELLRVPRDIRPITVYFLDVYLLLLPGYYLFVMANAVFRARKQVFVPLAAMILVMVVNTVGDFGLGLGLWGLPDMGYRGVAWTTFFAVGLGALFDLVILWRTGWIDLSLLPPWRWIRRGLPYLLSVAWPAATMQILWQSAYLVLFALTGGLPRENITALAALTAGIRLESILFLPAFALNMTAGILVGHSLGAGRPLEAYRFGLRTWTLGCLCISAVAVLLWPAIDTLAGILAPTPTVQQVTASYLRYNFLAIPFTVTSMVLGGAFTGAGATRLNMKIIGGTVWLVRLPLAYVLGHVVMRSPAGIWMAMLVSQAVQSLLMLSAYRRRHWFGYGLAAANHKPRTSGVRNASHLPAPLPGQTERVQDTSRGL